MFRSPLISAFSLGILCAVLLVSGEASAEGFQFGGLFKGGGGSPTVFNSADHDLVEDSETGLNMGGQAYFVFAANPAFSIGFNFDYSSIDSEGQHGDYDFKLPSMGLMTKLNLEVLTINAWANYLFGSMDETLFQSNTSRSHGLNGVQFGFNPAFRIQMRPYRTFIELGGFFSYNYATIDNYSDPAKPSVIRDVEWAITQFGFTLGVGFDVGGRTRRRGRKVKRQYGYFADPLGTLASEDNLELN